MRHTIIEQLEALADQGNSQYVDIKQVIDIVRKADYYEVTMNYLLAALDKATIAKKGVITWEEGLRTIRETCHIIPKATL
jgi:hypothetical protein